MILRCTQGSFCVCDQPMRDDITLYRHLSLAGLIHKMIPVYHCKTNHNKLFAYFMEHTEYNAAHYWQITEETKKNLFLDLINYGIGEPLTREGCMGFLPDT